VQRRINDATIKCATEDKPRKIATVRPIGVSNKVTGGAYVLPGGPDI